ncbi:MAG TPA: hypothetical protein VGK32_06660 [Vicinamibacterales bacterium]|jgi:hypothetical protein
MKSRVFAWFLIALTVVAVGCRKSANEPPVATPTLALDHLRVPLGSPLNITYEFKVAQNAPAFTEDYRVFVHFVDADDEMMWTDDHFPPTPTTQWKPGQTIKYNRLLFVPVYPYVGEATIDIGLYNKGGKRLVLAAADKGQHAYRMMKIQVLPQTENLYLTFKDGWHLTETAPDNPGNEWHWTKKDSTISFKNPKKDSIFFLELGGQPKLLAEPQAVTVSVGDQLISAFTLAPNRELRQIAITAAQFGQAEQVELKLHADKTFVPTVASNGAQSDNRELGLCVYHAFVQPK